MKEALNISVIQADLVWENPSANFSKLSSMFKSIRGSDIIILPETFNTGFTMNSAKVAEAMDGQSVLWMREQAEKHKSVICGSLIIKDQGNIFNRFVWMQPNGTYHFYDKRHLFRMGDEHKHFTPGDSKLVINYKGWTISPFICYDLRFPVWSRTDKHNPIDLLLYVANWPEPRIDAWEKLLYARAIENQCYVAACNRVGVDGVGVNCSGNSLMLDPKGKLLGKLSNQAEGILNSEISLQELNEFRGKFPVGKDADEFLIQ